IHSPTGTTQSGLAPLACLRHATAVARQQRYFTPTETAMNSHTPRYYDTYDCPLGELLLVMDDSGLMHLDLPHEKHPIRRDTDWQQDRPRFAEVRRQLDEYFAGQRHQFALPLS